MENVVMENAVGWFYILVVAIVVYFTIRASINFNKNLNKETKEWKDVMGIGDDDVPPK